MISCARSLRVAGVPDIARGGHIVSFRGVSVDLQGPIDSFRRLANQARGKRLARLDV